MTIGSIIQFGGYNWRVLTVKEDNNSVEATARKVLIISEEILETRIFDAKNNTWLESELYDYLNGEFWLFPQKHGYKKRTNP